MSLIKAVKYGYFCHFIYQFDECYTHEVSRRFAVSIEKISND